MADPTLEYIELRDEIGMIEQHSLEERIRRAQHFAPENPMPINGPGRRSHCWLCRQADERGESWSP